MKKVLFLIGYLLFSGLVAAESEEAFVQRFLAVLMDHQSLLTQLHATGQSFNTQEYINEKLGNDFERWNTIDIDVILAEIQKSPGRYYTVSAQGAVEYVDQGVLKSFLVGNGVCANRNSAISFNLRRNNFAPVVQSLINFVKKDGISNNDLDEFQRMIAMGVDIDAVDEEGNTVLHLLVRAKNECSLLIKVLCDKDQELHPEQGTQLICRKNNAQQTPCDMYDSVRDRAIAEPQRFDPVLRMLVAYDEACKTERQISIDVILQDMEEQWRKEDEKAVADLVKALTGRDLARVQAIIAPYQKDEITKKRLVENALWCVYKEDTVCFDEMNEIACYLIDVGAFGKDVLFLFLLCDQGDVTPVIRKVHEKNPELFSNLEDGCWSPNLLTMKTMLDLKIEISEDSYFALQYYVESVSESEGKAEWDAVVAEIHARYPAYAQAGEAYEEYKRNRKESDDRLRDALKRDVKDSGVVNDTTAKIGGTCLGAGIVWGLLLCYDFKKFLSTDDLSKGNSSFSTKDDVHEEKKLAEKKVKRSFTIKNFRRYCKSLLSCPSKHRDIIFQTLITAILVPYLILK